MCTKFCEINQIKGGPWLSTPAIYIEQDFVWGVCARVIVILVSLLHCSLSAMAIHIFLCTQLVVQAKGARDVYNIIHVIQHSHAAHTQEGKISMACAYSLIFEYLLIHIGIIIICTSSMRVWFFWWRLVKISHKTWCLIVILIYIQYKQVYTYITCSYIHVYWYVPLVWGAGFSGGWL